VTTLASVWPAELQVYLSDRYGDPSAIEPLSGGQSGATVERVRFGADSLVVKGPAEAREVHVYRALRSRFEAAGVLLPRLEWSSDAGWLVLEDLPSVLPVQDALAHAGMLAVLRRLHHELNDVELLDPFVSDWPPELTARALTALHPASAAEAAPRLHEMRQQALSLFNSQCVISGDPNPTNWGLRADGTAVLYDWERFGAGTPALDLAITVPGLGDPAAYAAVADGYLRNWPDGSHPLSWTPEQWSRAVAVAKLWSVVEFLHAHGRQVGGNTTATVERILPDVPNWVQELASVPGTR
jgi:hypothetical protein